MLNTAQTKKSLFIKSSKGPLKSIISSLVSIAIGLVVGLIIMIISSALREDITILDAFSGLGILISGPLSSGSVKSLLNNTGDVIFYSVPLIMTGLSVAIAYKTGLFNIGAPGQYLMGTIGCLLVALYLPTTNRVTGIMVWVLAFLAGAILGALWGMIPGILKALFNINEVIICIMTNWIAANVTTWLFLNTKEIISKENTKGAYLITAYSTGNFTPKLGLDKLFPGSYIDMGIFLAIIIAIIIFIILNKTTFGYELKACGSNREASKYAGLSEKKNIIFSMAIAGALAGMGACFYYLNKIEFPYQAQYSKLPDYGFNGIASAFLANCNPIGVIFSSIFIRWLNMGGEFLTKVGFNRYFADIVIAVIIYLAGFTRIIGEMIERFRSYREKKKEDANVKKGKETEPVISKSLTLEANDSIAKSETSAIKINDGEVKSDE